MPQALGMRTNCALRRCLRLGFVVRRPEVEIRGTGAAARGPGWRPRRQPVTVEPLVVADVAVVPGRQVRIQVGCVAASEARLPVGGQIVFRVARPNRVMWSPSR